MGVSLLLIGLTGLFWFLGMRNADEVIGILEKLMATLLLVLTLCVGGWHLAIGMGLLVVALSLPSARFCFHAPALEQQDHPRER